MPISYTLSCSVGSAFPPQLQIGVPARSEIKLADSGFSIVPLFAGLIIIALTRRHRR